MTASIDIDRLMAELHALATLTDCPQHVDSSLSGPAQAVTRIVFTPRDIEARAWFKRLALEAGFAVREDAVGNMFVRWEGSDPTLAAVGTGSHTDAIPHAGMYDGTVGRARRAGGDAFAEGRWVFCRDGRYRADPVHE